MANETQITIVGNLTDSPELRFTQNGHAVANFTIASTPRTFDKQAGEFKDGETLFMRCSAWRDMAENVAESLSRGTRVVAQGNLTSRTFETKEGERRTVMEMDVQEVGPSLKYATASVSKVDRRGQQQGQQAQGTWGGGQQSQQGPPPGQGGSWGANPNAQQDPWAQSSMTQQGGFPGSQEQAQQWGAPQSPTVPF